MSRRLLSRLSKALDLLRASFFSGVLSRGFIEMVSSLNFTSEQERERMTDGEAQWACQNLQAYVLLFIKAQNINAPLSFFVFPPLRTPTISSDSPWAPTTSTRHAPHVQTSPPQNFPPPSLPTCAPPRALPNSPHAYTHHATPRSPLAPASLHDFRSLPPRPQPSPR